MFNLSLTACSFYLKVSNSKGANKIFALNKEISTIGKDDNAVTFKDAAELFELFFQKHEIMTDDANRKMTFSCDNDFYITIPHSEFTLFRVKINSGIYGSSSDIIDGTTRQVKLKKSPSDIEIRPFFLYILLPKDSSKVTVNKGMFLFQNEGIYGIKTVTTELMQKFFSSNFGISIVCRTISPDLFLRKIVTQENLKKMILGQYRTERR